MSGCARGEHVKRKRLMLAWPTRPTNVEIWRVDAPAAVSWGRGDVEPRGGGARSCRDAAEDESADVARGRCADWLAEKSAASWRGGRCRAGRHRWYLQGAACNAALRRCRNGRRGASRLSRGHAGALQVGRAGQKEDVADVQLRVEARWAWR
jgi:hypothetical protein